MKLLLGTLCFASQVAFAYQIGRPCPAPDAISQKKLLDAGGAKRLEDIKFLDLRDDLPALAPYLCNLKGLEDLTWHNANDLKAIVDAVTPLASLKALNISSGQFSDLCPNGSCPLAVLKIKNLDISSNNLSSIAPGSLPKSLKLLSLAFNNNPDKDGAKPFGDMRGVAELTNLETLDADELYLQDLSFLRSLPNLTTLHLYHNRLTTANLADLAASPSAMKLTQVYMDNNNINDFSAVAEIAPQAWARYDGFRIFGNPIENCPMNTPSADFNLTCLPFNDNLEKDAAVAAYLSSLSDVKDFCIRLLLPESDRIQNFAAERCDKEQLVDILYRSIFVARRMRAGDRSKAVSIVSRFILTAVQKGFPVDTPTVDNMNLLTAAADIFNLPLVKLLISLKADKNFKLNGEITAYQRVQKFTPAQVVMVGICEKQGKDVLCDGVPFDQYKSQLLELLK